MEGIEEIGRQLNAVYEDVSPGQLSDAGPALEAASATVSELLGGSEAGEQIVGHLSEAQTRLANALVYLGDVRSSLGAYLTSIGFEHPEPPAEAAPSRLQALVDRQAEREAGYAAFNARLDEYRATFTEGAHQMSETIDTEILPEWPVAREALIEQLAVSPPAKIEVRHFHNTGRYEITARWVFREGDFDDEAAPTTHVTAYSSIDGDEAGSLMNALQLLRQPQQYRLPKRRGPYNVPVVWNDETGRFSYPAMLLWAGVSKQLATAAHRIDGYGKESVVSGRILENTVDLPTVADNLRGLASGHDPLDPNLPLIREIMKVHTNGAEGAVQYLRQRYIDGKRQEIQQCRKATDLIARAQPVPGYRGIEIMEVRY